MYKIKTIISRLYTKVQKTYQNYVFREVVPTTTLSSNLRPTNSFVMRSILTLLLLRASSQQVNSNNTYNYIIITVS